MSFYTFSSNFHRNYAMWMGFLTFFPICILFFVGVFLEPAYGDLTRVGLYAEREFGWNKPQLSFSKAFYTEGQYTKYHDVVVIGDSFSKAKPLQQWQNYFVNASGLSLVTLNIEPVKWEQILKNDIFQKSPPKIVILESIERGLAGRIKGTQVCNFSDFLLRPNIVMKNTPKFLDVPIEPTKQIERDTSLSKIKVGFVARYIFQNINRFFTYHEETETRKVQLLKGEFFSSLNKNEMLIHKDDFQKSAAWHKMKINEMSCNIERIRSQIEANGKTQFVLMVAPDKLTVYADYTKENNIRDISLLSKLAEKNALTMPRIDIGLKNIIKNGEVDVYLPNDTHWGSSGQKVASDVLLDYLNIKK